MAYFVYIIYSTKCDKFYVGHTDSIERRLTEHNQSKGGTFSSNCMPWELRYHEMFETRSLAIKREKEIKAKKSRRYIEWLVSQR